MNKVVCKNCGQRFEGAFCNYCGQRARVRRVDRSYVVDEVTNTLFQLNSGLFYTIKELTIRPGSSIKAFLDGKRKRYVKPLSYLLLTSALYVLTVHFLGLNTFFQDFTAGFTNGITDEGNERARVILDVLNWMTNNHTFTVLLTLPVFSTASYLAFKKSGYNYFEHVILNIYITGHQMVIYLLSSFVVVEQTITEPIPVTLGLIYTFWALYQFFRDYKPFIRILRSLLTFIIFWMQILAFMFMVFGFTKIV